MRNYNTQAKVDNIPNVNYKRNVICQKYLNYGASTDIQGYLDEQITENPKLLAWLFDDSSLVGKNYLTLSPERFEALEDFYNSLSIYDD